MGVSVWGWEAPCGAGGTELLRGRWGDICGAWGSLWGRGSTRGWGRPYGGHCVPMGKLGVLVWC